MARWIAPLLAALSACAGDPRGELVQDAVPEGTRGALARWLAFEDQIPGANTYRELLRLRVRVLTPDELNAACRQVAASCVYYESPTLDERYPVALVADDVDLIAHLEHEAIHLIAFHETPKAAGATVRWDIGHTRAAFEHRATCHR